MYGYQNTIYMVDHQHVWKLNLATSFATDIAGTSSSGFGGNNGPATLGVTKLAVGVCADTNGNVYITDYTNNMIRFVSASTQIITTVAGTGASTYCCDGGPATSAALWNPQDVWADTIGNFYIGDTPNNRVRKVNPAGIISTFAGTGSGSSGGNGVLAINSAVNNPIGVRGDSAGTIYIAENHGCRIQYVTPSGIINTLAGTGTCSFTQVNSYLASGAMNQPYYLHVDINGAVYFTSDAVVLKIVDLRPSYTPTHVPSAAPSIVVTITPSFAPSVAPTAIPTVVPSTSPSFAPSLALPTSQPSSQPSDQPYNRPSGQPTSVPSSAPSYKAESWGQVTWDKHRHRQGGLCENHCSNHGTCEVNMNCKCFTGLDGQPEWTGPDCSLRTCPKDISWIGDVVASNNLHPVEECSNKGLCDRSTGTCNCFTGYDGIACQRTVCPNNCNDRGSCWPEKLLAGKADRVYQLPWDAMKHVGCFCDKGYRGPACEFQECPSGADPLNGYGNEAGETVLVEVSVTLILVHALAFKAFMVQDVSIKQRSRKYSRNNFEELLFRFRQLDCLNSILLQNFPTQQLFSDCVFFILSFLFILFSFPFLS
jgi:hypothetical protein